MTAVDKFSFDLFPAATSTEQTYKQPPPLAEAMRPATWQEFVGLADLDANLLTRLQSGRGRAPSLILWGPPGSGKTTLAKLIGRTFKVNFIELSAVLAGVKEVREVVEQAKRAQLPTLLFVDEIHRFNKAQQDAFLPHVERGVISLIGATTENPSFYLNSALLSRCRVLVLPALSEASLFAILERAAKNLSLQMQAAAQKILIEFAGSDARKLLNLVEALLQSKYYQHGKEITLEDMQAFLADSKTLYYDRSDDEHYNMVSAFIKSMRGSDADGALYWAFRMIESGEDPRFILRRMMIFASEDISNADPRALTLAVSASDAFEKLGMPEGRIPIAHCITYLASAPKSNRSYVAMNKILECIKEQAKVEVPIHLRNAPTKLMKQLGYGKEYAYAHDYENAYVKDVQYLPDHAHGRKFYEPSEYGYEKIFKDRLAALKKS